MEGTFLACGAAVFLVGFLVWTIVVVIRARSDRRYLRDQMSSLKRDCPLVIKQLAAYTRERDTAVTALLGLMKDQDYEVGTAEEYELIYADLMVLIKKAASLGCIGVGKSSAIVTANPSDSTEDKTKEPSREQIRPLQVFAAMAGRESVATTFWREISDQIMDPDLSRLMVLETAAQAEAPDRIRLRDMYLGFSELICTDCGKGLIELRAWVEAAARTPGEDLEEAQRLLNLLQKSDGEAILVSARGVLGIDSTATEAEIRSQYRKLVSAYHPDRVDGLADELQDLATTRMIEINEAYKIITDAGRR